MLALVQRAISKSTGQTHYTPTHIHIKQGENLREKRSIGNGMVAGKLKKTKTTTRISGKAAE